MSRPALFQALEPIVEAFEGLSVPYCLGGSVASSAYGTARTTLDVDLVADLDRLQVPRLVHQLGERYYANQATILDAVARESCFNVIHLATMFKVDVFPVKSRPYDRVAFDRKREGRFAIGEYEGKFVLSSPEDIVINKLEWFRLGDEVSERQWQDVLGVLRVQQGRLDEDYLTEWASALDLRDLLQRARREVGPSEASDSGSTPNAE
jgi:hypothetical protein